PEYFWDFEDIGEPRSESGFKAILQNVESGWVAVTVRWSSLLGRPVLNSYEVGINKMKLAKIEVSDDARQVNIAFLHALNPIFLEDSSFDEAFEAFKRINLESETLADDVEKLGILFPLMAEVLEFDESGIPGLSKPIGVLNQKGTALPNWGSILHFDYSLFSEQGEEKYTRDFIEVLSSLIVGPGELVLKALQEFKYIGPLREIPSRSFNPELSPNESNWSSGKAAWDLVSNLDEDSAKLEIINDWLSANEKLNSGYRIELKRYKELDLHGPLAVAIKQGRNLEDLTWFNEQLEEIPTKTQLLLKDTIKELDVLPQDVGVGISQVLPVVVSAVCSESGIVVVEQPELHVHAAFQVAMGDLFASMIRNHENDKENKNIIFLLETHSEYMTLRFLRRLYETSQDELEPGAPWLTPNDLAVYCLNPKEEGVEIRLLRVDEEGEFLDRWPRGFFAERKRELF
ncbi:MAG: AAA family ATPase, partial [Proteobacteria bacterium]|nr:AAA family ATPase [Pseudomonadota bacterium]